MEVLRIIRQHPDADVVFGIHRLGKEALLCRVAEELGVRMRVSAERMEWLKIVGIDSVFTCGDETPTRFSVRLQREVTPTWLAQMNAKGPVIAIIPSSLHWAPAAEDSRASLGLVTGSASESAVLAARVFDDVSPKMEGPSGNVARLSTTVCASRMCAAEVCGAAPCRLIFRVAYSDHSSYSELRDFIAALRPQSIVPFVRSTPTDVQECFGDLLPAWKPRAPPAIPASVADFMAGKRSDSLLARTQRILEKELPCCGCAPAVVESRPMQRPRGIRFGRGSPPSSPMRKRARVRGPSSCPVDGMHKGVARVPPSACDGGGQGCMARGPPPAHSGGTRWNSMHGDLSAWLRGALRHGSGVFRRASHVVCERVHWNGNGKRPMQLLVWSGRVKKRASMCSRPRDT